MQNAHDASQMTLGVSYEALDERAQKVTYEDLNIDTLAGASILYHRIERAARAVCGADTLLPHGQWKSCYRMAVAAAVAKVNSPWLTAIHDTKNGVRLASLRSPRLLNDE